MRGSGRSRAESDRRAAIGTRAGAASPQFGVDLLKSPFPIDPINRNVSQPRDRPRLAATYSRTSEDKLLGQITNVECSACGYEARLTVGRGMRGEPADDDWPVVCARCKAVVSSKINQGPIVCGKCGSKEVAPLGRIEPLQGEDDGDSVHAARHSGREKLRWGARVLDDAPLACPRCGHLALWAATRPGIMFD
jgi:DNA-directed RNA polymerase subunit RPC12/RpoP